MKNTQSLASHSTEETVALGAEFASRLTTGGVLLLHGELGSGKTHFVQGIVKGLGIQQQVKSPTFAIIHEYTNPTAVNPAGITQVIHLDLYRLHTLAEAATLDLPSLANTPNALVCVEWPNQIPYTWPNVLAEIEFEHTSESARNLLVRFN